MAFSTVMCAAVSGLRVDMVHVEADVSNGLPVFHMVGYLSSEVKEAAERVKTAIRNTGISLPPKKMIVNLSPATVRKKGASFDLPIALAILASVGCFPEEKLKDTWVIGELSLDGSVQKVSGILPIVMEAKKAGCRNFILPKENAPEGALVEGVNILGVRNLSEACLHLKGEREVMPEELKLPEKSGEYERGNELDFSEIQGQEMVKRAVEIAVAGGHNLLLIGPPGSGKSMVAKRIPTILPPIDAAESMEITKIYSVLGLVDQEHPLVTGRPFRSVHHTVTKTALTGGGMIPVPGEISLAHGGVLFLDELAEFQKPVLEVLRQPLEEKKILISRNHGNYVFPADFMLVSAMNPCPCGNYPDLERCTCTPGQIQRYLGKVSQPFLDRMDICVEVPKMRYEELKGGRVQESSKDIRERVCMARERQRTRYEGTGIRSNALLGVKELDAYCVLGAEEEKLMRQAYTALGLTARTYHKVLKVARTIADLEGNEKICADHIKEAIGYRTLDKKYWGR